MLVLSVFFMLLRKDENQQIQNEVVKKVDLLDISESSGARASIVASGKIEAAQEAVLVSETSGVVRSVNASIGDAIGRGQILVSLSNADAAAAVAGAKAALATAETGVSSSEVSLANSRIALIDSIQSSLFKAKDTLYTQISSLYTDPDVPEGFGVSITSSGISYTVEASDRNQNNTIANLTSDAREAIFKLEKLIEGGVSEDEIIVAANQTEQTLLILRDLLNNIASVLSSYKINNSSEQTFYGTFKTTVSTSQTSINTSLSSLRGALQAYNSSLTSERGASSAQARAALDAAQAQYAKTLVRAPFAGKILSVNAKVGEYVTVGTPMVSILDSSSKKVTVYLSASDALNVSVGAKALVNGIHQGVVAEKAPGIDSSTGKVEAVIYMPGDTDTITGEYADVTISSSDGSLSTLMLPLQAVKMSGETPSVLIISEGVVKSIPVEVGNIKGDRIEIISELVGVASVISNTRGISPGDTVEIRKDN